jgi:hypothetical protein
LYTHQKKQHPQEIKAIWPQCSSCNKHFPNKTTLGNHSKNCVKTQFQQEQQATTKQEEQFMLLPKCDFCSALFRTFEELADHKQEIHLPEPEEEPEEILS